MTRQSSKSDVFYYFLLNVSSAFMLSAAHNVLFFVLDVRTSVIHFLHFFTTFGLLSLLRYAHVIPSAPIEFNTLKYAVGFKILETLLVSGAHSQNRTGELYLIRVFDFLFTLTIVGYQKKSSKSPEKPEGFLVVPLALATSLSWLEWGQLEHTPFSMLCAIFLPIVRAFSVLKLQEAFEMSGKGHADNVCFHYTRLVSAGLFIPALMSFLSRDVQVTASWESIDYTLMSLSFLFMACNLYSELWLVLHVNANSFTAFESTKMLAGSIAQWIIQNMAHPNLLAFGGKIVALASMFVVLFLSIAGSVLGEDLVTCMSVLKLMNANEGSRLHSHDVKYGSGSGQQSVTGVKSSDDINSHWQIFPALTESCHRGDSLECGSKLRLKHLSTGCFLHSHHFQGPLSKQYQEVSCFGSEKESDTGDHWTLMCNEDVWSESDQVRFKHVDTGVYLALSGQQFGRPISGQREVVGTDSLTNGGVWKAAEGVYVVHQNKN
ncbi:unnamed protein product [Caenorhabditis auriculariae]|uniref:MIR domain-containing protein n=1 Tax=Caenorhabditis auriculariae TaxID=2777116 RepID=A0A8S1HM47_9PELO|nr:unnamed protein product [Caenorhabditis auriculariae]